MTLAQKRMAAMIMETTVEDVEAHRARQAAAEAEAAAAVGQTGAEDDDAAMEESDDEDKEVQERKKREDEERQRELERARAIQASSLEAGGPMKIRTDYVPKLGKKGDQKMTTCTICGQQIAVDELQEHMRIELLDPRWKEQRDRNEARQAQLTQLQSGANVESSLKSLARARVDIFGTEVDEETRKQEEQMEQAMRKEREKVVVHEHARDLAQERLVVLNVGDDVDLVEDDGGVEHVEGRVVNGAGKHDIFEELEAICVVDLPLDSVVANGDRLVVM